MTLPNFCGTLAVPAPRMSAGRLAGAMTRYKTRPMPAARIVVNSVYVTAWRKMRPVLFFAPRAERVVMTAKAMVGTATNWNRCVKTVARKLNRLLRAGMFSQPRMAPTMRAPIQRPNWRHW